MDGKSLVPILKDKNHETLHNAFCWENGIHRAERKGEWELLGNPVILGEEFAPKDSLFLVNLETDPGEMTNLAKKYPEKVKELNFQFEQCGWIETGK